MTPAQKKIFRKADREMKMIYNSHFPEEQADDTDLRLFSKQQTEDRYERGFKFWNEQLTVMTAEYEKHKTLKNKYKLMICLQGCTALKARLLSIESLR